MPALNEEANLSEAIQDVLNGFQRAAIDGEIIVVNDGSTDGTAKLLKAWQARLSNLIVVTHDSPQGIGRSFWDGSLKARGETVTLLPGDGENDAYEILRYVPLLESVDLVVPFVFNRGTRSRVRQLVSYLYRRIVQVSFGLTVNYFNGTVLYRTNVLRQFSLSSNGFFYQAELLIKIIRAGYLYAEVPYGLKTRVKGASKAIRLSSLLKVMKDFISLFISTHFSKAQIDAVEKSATKKRQQQFPDPSYTIQGKLADNRPLVRLEPIQE